jgi:hypothetical protein
MISFQQQSQIKIIISGVIVFLVLVVSLVFYFRYAENKKYEKRGIELITQIEDYRRENNRLPNIVADLGIVEQMGKGPYYEKKDSLNYVVFFNIGFDNTKTYYSETKEWKNEP